MIDYDRDSPEFKSCLSMAVGVATLHSSPTNPRKTFDAAKLAELVASVQQVGILQPILVRPWPVEYPWTGDMPLYEVVAGERRFRAAQAAGIALMPAMVRHLTTQEVLEIQTIENLQREDLHPLEEAEGYEVMMKQYGYTADALADKIGKSRSYVFGRTKLLQLGDEAREKEQKKALAKAETERAVRERLFDNIRTEVWNYTLDGAVTFPAPIMLTLLQDLVVNVFQRAYDDTALRMVKLWDIEGKNNTERKQNFPAFAAQCDAATCWKMLVDLRCVGELTVTEYSANWTPEKLESTARLFSIDPDEVRKDVISERKAQEKAEKQAKKAKKPAVPPAAEASSPCKAARATEDLRAENPFKVGDRVKLTEHFDEDVNGDFIAKFRGKEGLVAEVVDDNWCDVVIDGETKGEHFAVDEMEKIETNETPTGAEPAEVETPVIDTETAGPGIEMNETPKAPTTGQASYCHPDDPSLTWTGRGRRPKWIEAWLDVGGTLADLRRAA